MSSKGAMYVPNSIFAIWQCQIKNAPKSLIYKEMPNCQKQYLALNLAIWQTLINQGLTSAKNLIINNKLFIGQVMKTLTLIIIYVGANGCSLSSNDDDACSSLSCLKAEAARECRFEQTVACMDLWSRYEIESGKTVVYPNWRQGCANQAREICKKVLR